MKQFLFAAALLLPNALNAHDYSAETLQIAHPYSFERSLTAKSSAGYLEITNTGETADVLMDVKADFPKVMIHTTVTENDVTKMMHVDGVTIEPGQTVTLEPGGYHIMFMGKIDQAYSDGDSFPATLVFKHAGDIDVVFNVEPRQSAHKKTIDSQDKADHTHH